MNQPPDLHDPRPIALTIAGSDSGGGAGIQADLKTFEAFGVFGTSVITAVTAQNTVGVDAALAMPAELVAAQIRAVLGDLPPAAAKTGMLATAEIATAVIDCLETAGVPRLVVDPVMVATSGDRLLAADGVEVLRSRLLPLALIVTPNLSEAAWLTEREVRNRSDMSDAARRLVDAGAASALVKGGHLPGDRILDVLWDGTDETVWEASRIARTDTHGTGCTLSAAVTAGLASGRELIAAVDEAISYTRRAIASAPGLGSGNGPLDHRGAAADRGDYSP